MTGSHLLASIATPGLSLSDRRRLYCRTMQIFCASTDEDIRGARILFQEYAAWLQVDLCFQNFTRELASLPGAYAAPEGRLLLAKEDAEYAGCVALRSLEDGVCEVKRLFVRPAFRGRRLGKLLVERVIQEAKSIGYSKMKLDTLPSMTSALKMYERFGFVPTAPYYATPVADTIFLELTL